jgi:ABC-type Na+ efflux pump permease subunit
MNNSLRKVLLLAKRDYLASVRSKTFIIGLVVAPLLFGGGLGGIALMKKKPDLSDKRIAILDRTGVVAEALIRIAEEKTVKEAYDKKTHRQIAARYVFESVPVAAGDPDAQRVELSSRVRKRELLAFLEIFPEALHPGNRVKDEDGEETDAHAKPVKPRVAYYSNASGMDQSRNWLSGPLNRAVGGVLLERLGVERGQFEDLLTPVSIDSLKLIVRDTETGKVAPAKKKDEILEFSVPFAVMMLLSMIVMVGTAPMLSSVTEDKNQRIFEMLMGLVTPMELMSAHVLAALARSLTSSAFYIASALMVLQGMAMMGAMPFGLLPWFFTYLVAEVIMLGALAAGLGAACSSPQDAQNLAVLLLTPILLPMLTMMSIMTAPNGAFATVMSLIPPFTPITMMLRQAMPAGIPAWQPWVGLIGVAIWTILGTWAAARIFRVAILMQGQPPRLAQLVRWAWAG